MRKIVFFFNFSGEKKNAERGTPKNGVKTKVMKSDKSVVVS